MSRRFQFSLKWLSVAMLAAACFFGGIHFERERRRRADDAVVEDVSKAILELRNQARAGTRLVDLEGD